MGSKAYITNRGNYDYSGLQRWVTEEAVINVTKGNMDRKLPMATIAEIASKLIHFEEEDYLVFSGSAVAFAYSLTYLFLTKNFEAIKLLYYQQSGNLYFGVTLRRDYFLEALTNYDDIQCITDMLNDEKQPWTIETPGD